MGEQQKIDEILKIVKDMEHCLRGDNTNYKDAGLIGQVESNRVAIKWLVWLYGINVAGYLGFLFVVLLT